MIPPSGWKPPEEFDDLKIIKFLARGAMGEVWLARDLALERLVAVKFISAVLDPTPQQKERFLQEARANARLYHTNVLAIHRIGYTLGRPYIAAEYVRGHSLDKLEKPIPSKQLLRLALGLARGLAAAHRRGVIHRDVKPANAMYTDEGDVKIVDFGLAKFFQEDLEAAGTRSSDGSLPGDVVPLAYDLTRVGAVVGTPEYMAPELFERQGASVLSDLYGLGALLFELGAGRRHRGPRPKERDLGVLLAWARVPEPPPLDQIADDMDPRLAAAVARCLRLDPLQRFPSAEALVGVLDAIAAPAALPPLPEGNPYRGLQPFEAEHRALFFGRGPDVRLVIERLRAEPLLVVTGDSGVGKSSLCRAGVIPLFADGTFEAGRCYGIARLLPGRHPVLALAAALAPHVGRPEAEIAELAVSDAAGLGRLVRERARATGGVLVFVDQLEELVTLSDPKEAGDLSQVLEQLTIAALPGLRVLCTVRGDFLTRIAALSGLGAQLARSYYILTPLSAEGARQAVTMPAERKGARFESETLINTLSTAATDAAGGLPTLQFALAELWDRRDVPGNVMTAAALEKMGGVGGALARHADSVLATLDEAARAAARTLLPKLVAPEGTRARRTATELGAEAPATARALAALVGGRVVVARETGGEIAYEVAHEALLSAWQTLRDWLDRDADRRRLVHRLEMAAETWEHYGRTRVGLWLGRQLDASVALDPGELSPRAAAFLAASRRAARMDRLRRRAMALAVPALVAMVWGALELNARHRLARLVTAREAKAASLLAEGRNFAAQAEPLRQRAFAGFDALPEAGKAGHPPTAAAALAAAEATWDEVQQMARRADDALVRASLEAEAAHALDPRRRSTGALVADVTLARIDLAERARPAEDRSELRRRLETYDADGSRARLLAQPPVLEIRTEPPGAAVSLAGYADERGRSVLGPPRALGSTPLATVPVPDGPGSYLLTLELPGHVAVRYPVLLARGERLPIHIDLPAAAEVPEGLVYIPPGRFLYGSAEPDDLRRGFLRTAPIHERTTGGYLIGTHEVTIAEWIAFLAALPPDRRRSLTRPVTSPQHSLHLRPADGAGGWRFSLGEGGRILDVAEGEPAVYRGRAGQREQDWRRFPAGGISRTDALAYVAWLDSSGRVPGARLCTEAEWERAARGADRRHFPHGNHLEPDDANFDETYGRQDGAFGPDAVGSHPASRSPFGVEDMMGNILELVETSGDPAEVVGRGGTWYYDRISGWTNNRILVSAETRDPVVGLRVCSAVHKRSSPAQRRPT